jgi:transglutaminase-like putative cysteine protease
MGGRVATLLAIALSAWYLLQLSRQNVAAPMVGIAVLLLSIRFVTAKSHRNHLQIMALSLFCLAASSLYGLSPYFLAVLLIQLFLTTLALVFLTFYQRDQGFTIPRSDLGPLLRTALTIPLATIPLMVFFFFILPRTQFPLWDLLARGGSERAGVSETLQPGDKSSISTGGGVVFRAAMEKIPPASLYWRCMVLNSFDGRNWKRVSPPTTDAPSSPGTNLIEQTVFLEPGQTPYYPGLDLPVQLGIARGSRTADNLFQPYHRGGTRLKYRMQSSREPAPPGRQVKIDRAFYTALPSIPPRLAQLGREVRTGYRSDRERIDALEKLFIGSRLTYGTTGLPTGDGAMEDFLFTTKRGHCELFAATFALLLRAAGVPARLVGGYLGGEYSDVGGYYLVTSGRAHIWVEAWLEGSGWVRIDPSRLTESFGEVTGRSGRSLQSRFAVYVDALNYYWNSVVINYDLERQISLVTTAGSNLRQLSLPSLSRSTLASAGIAILLLGAVVLLARRRPRSAEEHLISRFRKLLKRRYGVDIPPGTGLRSVVAPLGDEELNRFVAIYSEVIYRDCSLSDGELRELRGILTGLEKRGKQGKNDT